MVEINEGSQKQIAWAKKIQAAFYAAAADLISVTERPMAPAAAESLRARADVIRRMIATAEMQNDANWWISLRTKLAGTVALSMEAEYVTKTDRSDVRAYVEQWWWDVA